MVGQSGSFLDLLAEVKRVPPSLFHPSKFAGRVCVVCWVGGGGAPTDLSAYNEVSGCPLYIWPHLRGYCGFSTLETRQFNVSGVTSESAISHRHPSITQIIDVWMVSVYRLWDWLPV